jgi:hypothetical protein
MWLADYIERRIIMVKSNLLAEFAVSKDRLIQAQACVSNLADRAVVQAIVHPKDTILGFAFSNTLINGESGDQIYAYYIIVQEEMMGAKFMVNGEEWPLFYISCSEQFINSIAALEPRDNQFLKVELLSITEEDEPDVLKSEAFIMGDHNSAVGSILQHPSSQDDDTTLDADDTQSVLYG